MLSLKLFDHNMVDIYEILDNGSVVPADYGEKIMPKVKSLVEILSKSWKREDGSKYRYKEFGPDQILYHGTNIDNIQQLQISYRDNSLGDGVYLTLNKDIAKKFAEDRYAFEVLSENKYPGIPVVYSVKVNRKLKLLDLTDGSYLEEIIKGFKYYLNNMKTKGKLKIDSHEKRKAYNSIDNYDVFYDNDKFVTSPFSEEFRNYLWELGYDGIIHGNKNLKYAPFDYGIGSYTQVVIFNPDDISIDKKEYINIGVD